MANTFSSFENRVISFDIETTGLDPSNLFGEKAPGLNQKGIKPRIWALGFHIPGQDTPQGAHPAGRARPPHPCRTFRHGDCRPDRGDRAHLSDAGL